LVALVALVALLVEAEEDPNLVSRDAVEKEEVPNLASRPAFLFILLTCASLSTAISMRYL
jgi:hypothetical protein